MMGTLVVKGLILADSFMLALLLFPSQLKYLVLRVLISLWGPQMCVIALQCSTNDIVISATLSLKVNTVNLAPRIQERG